MVVRQTIFNYTVGDSGDVILHQQFRGLLRLVGRRVVLVVVVVHFPGNGDVLAKVVLLAGIVEKSDCCIPSRWDIETERGGDLVAQVAMLQILVDTCGRTLFAERVFGLLRLERKVLRRRLAV